MGCSSSQSVEVANTTPVANTMPTTKSAAASPPPKPKYKLIYFDTTGRAEITRLIFAATKTKFIDERIKEENWPDYKSKTPLGKIPILEVEDKPILCQSIAIARFAAKEVGLAGKDSIEMAKVDAVVDTLSELFEEFATKIFPQLRNPTPEKEQVFSDFTKDVVPKHFEKFETLIKLYGDKENGFFVGNKLTWADLFFHEVVTDLFMALSPAILDNYKLLIKNREAVFEHPNLKGYFEKRKSA